LPSESDLRAAADFLNSGKKVALLVAEVLWAVWMSLICWLRNWTLLSSKPSLGRQLCLMTVLIPQAEWACSAPKRPRKFWKSATHFSFYIEFYPKPDQAKAVQIDMDPMRIGNRYPLNVALVGDSKKTLLIFSILQTNNSLQAIILRTYTAPCRSNYLHVWPPALKPKFLQSLSK
jgi:hypothetical protein